MKDKVSIDELNHDLRTAMTAEEEKDYLSQSAEIDRLIFGDADLSQCLVDTTLDSDQVSFLSHLFNEANRGHQNIFLALWAEQLKDTAENFVLN